MMKLETQFITLLVIIFSLSGCFGWGSSSEKVLLKHVEAITLREGKMTAGRRSNAVPQLSYRGSSTARPFAPKTVQCINRGSDGVDVQWECIADLPKEVEFDDIDVSCEGYDYPDDPYILKGSCGLTYSLKLTGQGQGYGSNNYHYGGGNTYSNTQLSESKGFKWGNILVIGVIIFIIYTVYNSCIVPPEPSTEPSPPPTQPPPRSNRLYPDLSPPPYPGTGPSAPHDTDAPPPYGWAQDTMPGGAYQRPKYGPTTNTRPTGSSTYTTYEQPGGSQTRTQTNTQQGNQGWGGFWTGAATGGILGYLFGNRGQRDPYYHHRRPGWGNSGWGNSAWGYSGGRNRSWGSGWGSGSRSTGSSWFGGSSGSSGSSTRRATGFGGTSRR